MKFVDEASVTVIAGNGGSGSCSFRREKFIPRGGPDGGDGGDGGNVQFVGESGLNTLSEFRFIRVYKSENGTGGKGRKKYGADGVDLMVKVPLGTLVYDGETHELIGEVIKHEQTLLVAKGGKGGLGNVHFKSSINQAPKRTSPGEIGEVRRLNVELKVLADVGLLGFPNAGKSTLLRAVSAATPKVADYPFTTLHPELGVVDFGASGGFVIADIPGLIEGAADGVGLGVDFLKHLSRTGLLLHVVDAMPMEEDQLPADAVPKLEKELWAFNEELANKERWLVVNKIELLPEDEREAFVQKVVDDLAWKGPVYAISALSRLGTGELMQAISQRLMFLKEEAETEA